MCAATPLGPAISGRGRGRGCGRGRRFGLAIGYEERSQLSWGARVFFVVNERALRIVPLSMACAAGGASAPSGGVMCNPDELDHFGYSLRG